MANSLTEAGWADAFLLACRENRLPGFDVPSEAILLSEIDFVCREAPEETRSRMRSGVAISLERYSNRHYSIEVLRRLASIAAATVSTGAVPALVRYFIALHPYFKQENSIQFVVAIELVSALGTFPNNPQVARLFRTLLFDEADPVHFRFAAMLTIGVIRNDSGTFVSAMNRFCQMRALGEQHFHDRTIMRAMFKAVLPVNIQRAVEKKSGLSEIAKLYVTRWAIELGVLQNVFAARSTTASSGAKSAMPLEVDSFAGLRSIYAVTTAERGGFRGIQDGYRQRSRKAGIT